MEIVDLHSWELTSEQARELQERLRSRVETSDRLGPLSSVAGIDVGFDRSGGTARAAVAVLSWPDLEPVAEARAELVVHFPYVPGLLSFRELPAVLAALRRLKAAPDLLICDGQGYAHPRRFGLACHLGVVTDLPAIGVAKSRLIGEHDPLPPERGARVPLRHHGEVIGTVLRTRSGVRPVYVSIGHRVSLATAEELTLAAATRYRLPETTRRAHRLASG